MKSFGQFSKAYKEVDFREEVLDTVPNPKKGKTLGGAAIQQGIRCVEDYDLLPNLTPLASSDHIALQPFLKTLGSEIAMAKRWIISNMRHEKYRYFVVYELLKVVARLQVRSLGRTKNLIRKASSDVKQLAVACTWALLC